MLLGRTLTCHTFPVTCSFHKDMFNGTPDGIGDHSMAKYVKLAEDC